MLSDGSQAYEGSLCNDEVDLAYLKDFLLVLQSCNVRSFSGYGITVSFVAETSFADSVPRTLAEVGAPPADPSHVTVSPRDGWMNPNLWPQQNGKVLQFDGSFK